VLRNIEVQSVTYKSTTHYPFPITHYGFGSGYYEQEVQSVTYKSITHDPANRPNVLWIFADQLRYHALSCSGDINVQTPNIDHLAAEGVRCTAAFSHTPVCTPFRAGLMTGRYPTDCGVPLHGDLLPPGTDTVAHSFQRAGYRTSYVGKWHLGGEHGINFVSAAGWAGEDFWVHPLLRGGFEDWFGFNVSNNYYRTFYSTGERLEPHMLEGYQTDGLTDLSLDYLRTYDRDEPWFHVISYESPHPAQGGTPRFPLYPVPEKFERMFEPEQIVLRDNVPPSSAEEAQQQLCGYYALIVNLDENVGRLLSWLEESDVGKRTLVVFFSDHGEMAGSHGLRNKQVPYEESVRIPLLFRHPGVLPAGSECHHLISGIDIYPTTAGLCGVPIPSPTQGIDCSETLLPEGEHSTRSSVLIQWEGTRFAFGDHPYRGIRTQRHTYVVGRDDEFCMLFDNEEDPYQLHNRFASDGGSDLRRELHQRLMHAIGRSGEAPPGYVTERAL
jgi:arylsulfatase A-like enzyme